MRPLPLAVAGLLALIPGAAPAQTSNPTPTTPPTTPTTTNPAPAPAPGRLTLTTDRVVIFKDGHTLISKTATGVARADGSVFTEEVPEAAVLGCFWASADGAIIRSMKAEWVEETSERTVEGSCLTVLDLLRANRGRPVSLGLATREGGTIAGTIVEVLDGDPVVQPAEHEPPHMWPRTHGMPELPRVPGERIRPIVRSGGELVVLDLADGTRMVHPVPMIQTVSGPGLVTTTSRRHAVTTSGKRLTFQPSPPERAGSLREGEKVSIRLFYFSPGIRWIPTYRIATGGPTDTTAEISLQGEILNELEDVAGARVDLVVGVPSFRFKGLISPLSLERELRNALAAAAPQLMNQQLSNAMFSQRASEYTAGSTPGSGAESLLALAPELAQGAAGEQDLFVYTLDKFDLKKGARAAIPLWTTSAPAEHVYTLACRLGPRNLHPVEAISDTSPLRLADGRVWHQLELRNNASTPWTTGAALLLRDGLPLGQDMLTYTPVKSCTLLPITVAVDVQSTVVEEELERTHNALKINGTSYTRLKKKATITLTSFRSLASNIRLSTMGAGTPGPASEGATIRLSDLGSSDQEERVNSRFDASWSFALEPGATRTVTLEFDVYVR